MFADDSSSTIGRSLAGYLAVVCVMSLSTSVAQIEGRKCVCTSKACKEAGVNTCRTKFSCYTELILTTGQEIDESMTTRGCTEGATPLLCATRSWIPRSRSVSSIVSSANSWVRVPWPRLKCCNSHDYCNDDHHANASSWMHEKKAIDQARISVDPETPDDVLTNRDTVLMIQSDQKHQDPGLTDQLLRHRVRPLHIAALVLAIAALISVLAACYVVTRFLRSSRYITDSVN